MSQEQVTYFGIDLGTTYSAISYIDETGRPTVVRDVIAESDTMPSVVYFESADNVIIGANARNMARIDPENVVERVKRQMGRERQWEFFGTTQNPASISALILRRLADYAQEYTQREVKQVVITVPAYFGMLERDATRNAGTIAGLDVIGIVPEPVAAALQYEMIGDATEKTVLVYDLGGGTFDTTVIRVTAGAIEVLCTDGDQELGGTDWDDRLVQHLLQEFTAAANPTEDPAEDAQFMQELIITAEQVKRALSQVSSRPVPLRFAGASAVVTVTRETFEEITRDLLDNTIAITDRTLGKLGDKSGSGSPKDLIDEVLLVGGSTKMPAVSARLTETYGWRPHLHDPDLAVAKGAARYALSRAVWRSDDTAGADSTPPSASERAERINTLAGLTGLAPEAIAQVSEKRITTVLPKAFGVRLVDASKPDYDESNPEASFYIAHMVHADDPLPSGPHRLDALTLVDNQQAVEVVVYEQAGTVESPDLFANKPVDKGAGLISGLPRLPRHSPLLITMTVNEDGLLTVHAVEPGSGRDLTIEVRVSTLTEEEIPQLRAMVSAIAVRS
ncbi:Hsp70 family protein [Micromonospora sp. NBC_01699]|uniref:Hsp70 family protein n=1 Tax=Micromonospora sp. NBC_01699 TaxID=2975984 RepID=UPI002E336C5B|nr:Hsp70 family protein [Micromonospora sp. NBC_01699]